jgi:hypothetical protein
LTRWPINAVGRCGEHIRLTRWAVNAVWHLYRPNRQDFNLAATFLA